MDKLILGDCLEELKKLPDKSIDLVLTSPPYDNLRDYNGYSFAFEATAEQIVRVLRDGGVCVWIVADATVAGSETGTSFRQALHFKHSGLKIHDTMIWQKSKMPQNHNRYEQYFEYMFIFSKGRPHTFNGIKDKVNVKAGHLADCSYRDVDGTTKRTSSYKKSRIAPVGLRGNVWSMPGVVSSKERCGHPAPFPLRLARDHIVSWSNKGDVVLDPFVGSGTTAVAAKQLGRHYIGIDVSSEYLEIARKRLEGVGECSNQRSSQSALPLPPQA